MKKKLNRYLWLLITGMMLAQFAPAQSAQKYNNSLRVQYGLFQYNGNKHTFLNNVNNNFLSVGLTYRHQLGRVSGLNLTGRYYKWNLNDSSSLSTNAAQAMWVLHARRVGSSWALHRFTPYIGIGVGVEKHQLKINSGKDSSFNNFYIPAEAGVLMNLSSRWSLGIFAEYKLAGAADIKKLAKAPEGKQDIVNTAGISLAWHFGRKKKTVDVPVVYTNPYYKEEEKRVAVRRDDAITKSKNEEPADTLKNILPIEKSKEIVDSTLKTMADEKDSLQIVLKTIKIEDSALVLQKRDTVLVRLEKMIADSLTANPEINNENKDLRIDSLIQKVPSNNKTNVEPSIESDSIVKDTALVIDKNNDKKIDSLIKVINNLNKQLKGSIPANAEQVIIRDTILIKPMVADINDEPVISRLKESYNQMSDMVDKNYVAGKLNEMELQKANDEAVKLRSQIAGLSHENELTFSELELIHQTISNLKWNVSSNQISSESPQQYLLQKNQMEMQEKLDRTLLELEYMKRNEAKIETSSIDPATQQLMKSQQLLQEKIAKMEMQNQQLNTLLEKIIEKKDTVFVQKQTAAPESKQENTNAANNIVAQVNFNVNSSIVRNNYKPSLKNLADSIINLKGKMIILSGFTDKSGNAEYNTRLSQKRVIAVKNELIKNGVRKEMILERYFGSDKATEKVNEDDRKVVIRLINQ